MSTINAYLTFNGNCREAMQFYQKCLGGELRFQAVGESPLSNKMPAKIKKCILHAELRNDKMVLFGSDMVGENGLLKGNAVSLTLNCNSENEIIDCYQKLSTGGEQTHPLEENYWGALLGGIKDKYGNNWLLNFKKK